MREPGRLEVAHGKGSALHAGAAGRRLAPGAPEAWNSDGTTPFAASRSLQVPPASGDLPLSSPALAISLPLPPPRGRRAESHEAACRHRQRRADVRVRWFAPSVASHPHSGRWHPGPIVYARRGPRGRSQRVATTRVGRDTALGSPPGRPRRGPRNRPPSPGLPTARGSSARPRSRLPARSAAIRPTTAYRQFQPGCSHALDPNRPVRRTGIGHPAAINSRLLATG